MSEQNNVYQFPNTPHNPNSEDNISDSSSNETIKNRSLHNGECVEIDLQRASEGALTFEQAKDIQEKRNDVDVALSRLDPNPNLIEMSAGLLETMDETDLAEYGAVKNHSLAIYDTRRVFLLETIGRPPHIEEKIKGESKRAKRAA